jgi:hypothetical protein
MMCIIGIVKVDNLWIVKVEQPLGFLIMSNILGKPQNMMMLLTLAGSSLKCS